MRFDRRSVPATIVLGVLSGCATRGPDIAFEHHDVVIGPAERQTVVAGHLLGGEVADLAVVGIEGDGNRSLRVYTLDDETWAPTLDTTLRAGVRFIDVGDVGGRDRLITYASGRLSWFDPESGTERELVAVTCDYHPPRKGEIPHVDVTRDLNDDGRDDLVVPEGHAFHVFVQTDDGRFAEPVRIGPSSGMHRIYGADGYRHDPWAYGRVHEMDYDHDGRTDLVFWNRRENHFDVHRQGEDGLFAATPVTFTTEVAFDSDELASLAVPGAVRNRRLDHGLDGALNGRVLYSLSDLDGDGVGDLVVLELKSGRRDTALGDTGALLKLRSSYEVHFGTPAPDGGTVFAADAGTTIRSGGIPAGMDPHDLDHDGRVEMMYTMIGTGLFDILGAVLTRSSVLDLDFYRMENGSYLDKPSTTRRITAKIPGKSGEQASLFPPVLIGDVDGDRRSDLLVGHGRKELRVFLGVPGPDLFVGAPQKVAVAVPTDEEYTWMMDLDRDGRQDVLMHHPGVDGPDRVTMLIAQ